MFKAYTDGYLSEMACYLKPAEVNNMVNAIRVITLELAIRFLDDYLNGDTYFKFPDVPSHTIFMIDSKSSNRLSSETLYLLYISPSVVGIFTTLC